MACALVIVSLTSFSQKTWIQPEISADMEITDNTVPTPSYAIFYADVLTPDGNYYSWYANVNPYDTDSWGYGSTDQVSFQSSNTSINVWKPIPIPQNYYTIVFHCEKRYDSNGALISRDDYQVYGYLDANDNLYISGKVNFVLN